MASSVYRSARATPRGTTTSTAPHPRHRYRRASTVLDAGPASGSSGPSTSRPRRPWVSTHIEQLGAEKVHPVLLVDEAHLLHQDVLDHLHILANYEWDSKALLSLVLIGLPETRQRLSLAKNRSLWSRIHTRLSLGEAAPGDTAEYIAYRLKHAGADRELFSSDAIALIHEETHGRLRDIDRVATDALRLGGRRKIRVVDRELVVRVFGDQEVIPED